MVDPIEDRDRIVVMDNWGGHSHTWTTTNIAGDSFDMVVRDTDRPDHKQEVQVQSRSPIETRNNGRGPRVRLGAIGGSFARRSAQGDDPTN